MIKYNLILFLLVHLQQFAQPVNSTFNYSRYSAEKLKEDARYLLETIESVHPDIYANIDTNDFNSEFAKSLASLNDSNNTLHFYKSFAPLISKIGDAHTMLVLPWKEWNEYADSCGSYFPIRVIWNDCLRARNTGEIPSGTRLLSINNHSCDSLFNEFKSYTGSETDSYKNFITANYFDNYLWLNGIDPPYKVVVNYPENSKDTLELDGKVISSKTLKARNYYEYKLLDAYIAYIDFRRMRNHPSEQFEDFIKRVFKDLDMRDTKGLIIDLRNNSGGNNEFGAKLLEYITDKPFRMCAEKRWKVSSQYRKYFRQQIPWLIRWITYPPGIWLAGLFTDELEMFTREDGEMITLKNELIIPGDNPLRYKGKVCFLIGNATFSSGVDLANAVQDYNIAPLFGQETGGIPNAFGNSYQFVLPNTRLSVSVSSARYVKANGDSYFSGGIKPDYIVEITLQDLINVKDPTLDKAINWILDKSNK